jgi:thioredoxin family protein
VGAIPHSKALVERLKDKPFAFLGVNSDGDRDKVKKLLVEHSIPWRNAIDGDTKGPLSTRWNVTGWPTIFILDAMGVIRYRDTRDPKQMDAAVDALLKEIEK